MKNKTKLNSSMKKYAFIVLNWNGKNHTKQCLGSLESIDYRYKFDIVLVDNGSEDGSQEELEEFIGSMKRRVSFIKIPKNTGFTGGHIEGIKHTNADIVCLLNNDAVVSSNILTEADTIINNLNGNFGAIGGRAYFWNDSQKAFDIWNEFFTYQKIDPYTATAYTIKGDPGESLAPKVVDTVSGACVFINRDAINKTGYLDNDFFAYYEETDLFARFKRCGYEIYYCPTIRYWHRFDPNAGSHGASSKHIKNFSLSLILRNQFFFAFKNFERKNLINFISWYYFRFLKSLIKFPFKPKDRNLDKIIIKTTFSNLKRIPGLISKRRKVREEIPQIIGYNSKIISDNEKKTVVFLSKPKEEVISFILSNTSENDRVHLSNSIPCELRFSHRCSILNTERSFIYGVSAASARTDSIIVIEDSSVDIKLFSKEFNKIKPNIPYMKKSKGLYAFSRAFAFELVGNKLNPGESVDWFKKPEPSRNVLKYKVKRILKKLFQKPYNALLLIKDYLGYRYRLEGYRGSLRAMFGMIKNLPFRYAHTVSTIRAGVHEQRLFVLRTKENYNSFLKLSLTNVSDIPVFINCRDRVESLKSTIKSIEKTGLKKIFLIDNQSSYPDLLKFYKTCPYQVILLGENMGHKAPWESLAVKLISGGNPYVVTDPDVVLSDGYTNETIKNILELFDMHPGYVKVGAGLEIDNIPDYYEHKNTVQKWEKQFWNKRIEKSNGLVAYDAEIDTTFAMYRPNTGYITLPSIRLGGKHTAKHLPWYQNSKKPNDEEKYYSDHASSAVNTWNKDSLPDYLQEYMS
jgi:GT2 family glycosyltransferase